MITTFKLIIFTVFVLGLLAIDFLGYSIMPKITYRQKTAAFYRLIFFYLITVIITVAGFFVFFSGELQ